MVYHVLNRAVRLWATGVSSSFKGNDELTPIILKGEDLGAFAWIMGEACIRVPMREQRRIGGVYATLSPSEIGRYA